MSDTAVGHVYRVLWTPPALVSIGGALAVAMACEGDDVLALKFAAAALISAESTGAVATAADDDVDGVDCPWLSSSCRRMRRIIKLLCRRRNVSRQGTSQMSSD